VTTSAAATLNVGNLGAGIFSDGTTPGVSSDASAYELGTRIQALVAGQVTAIRYWRPLADSGPHTGRLWRANGTPITSIVFTAETASGWQTATLPAPISIAAGEIFIVSVNNNANGGYAYAQGGLASAITTRFLSALVSGGVYSETPGAFPTSVYQDSHYFRDVLFLPGSASGPGNTPPAVNAGPNKSCSIDTGAPLEGTATDDGQPAALSTQWLQVSGPGTVTLTNAAALTTTASFTLPGTYTLRLVASDGAVSTSSDVLVTVNDSFTAWAARLGVPADGSDFNHDGVPNLMAYALGVSPTANNTAALPFATRENISGSEYLALTISRGAVAPGITYNVQVSGNLTQWNSGPAFTTVMDDTPTLLKVRDNIPIAPPNVRRFLRLQIAQP
jgi:Domain of unknown function (DUF4082)